MVEIDGGQTSQHQDGPVDTRTEKEKMLAGDLYL